MDSIPRHEKVWFEDGNIILISEASWAIIPRESFAICSSVLLVNEADIEGYKKVHLYDTAQEVECLLIALYNGNKESLYNTSASVTFATVVGLIKMGHKYQIEHLVKAALFRLEICYPRSLHAFETLGNFTSTDCPISDLTSQDSIVIIYLVRTLKLEASTILPAALYHCSQLPNTVLALGVQVANTPFTYCLPADDLANCLDAQDKFLRLVILSLKTDFSCSAHSKGAINCFSPKELTADGPRRDVVFQYDVLAPLGPRLVDTRICRVCVLQICKLHDERRKVIWNQLGEIFRVKSWNPSSCLP